MAHVYLRQIEPGFSMPETSLEISPRKHDWDNWVNNYIKKSKAILTVRRKNILLNKLKEFGVTEVKRRNNVVVDLEQYELDMSHQEALEVYAKKHEKLWIEFTEEAVNRADYPQLKSKEGLTKQKFAKQLE